MIYLNENIYLSITLIILSIIVFIESSKLPNIDAQFPRLISISLFITAIILMMSSLKIKVQEKKEKGYNYWRAGIIVAGLILYILILRWLGYLLSTGLLITYVISTLGYHKRKQIIIIAIVATVILYLIFKILLNVPLPTMRFFIGE